MRRATSLASLALALVACATVTACSSGVSPPLDTGADAAADARDASALDALDAPVADAADAPTVDTLDALAADTRPDAPAADTPAADTPAADAPAPDAPSDAPSTRCLENRECPDGYYCFGTGCGAIGRCEVMPVRCAPRDDESCGCDGVTYPTACDAARVGVRVAYAGGCATTADASGDVTPPGGCGADSDCGRGTWCCPATRTCFDPACAACCPSRPRPDAGACRADDDCADGRSCCVSTGVCYDARCLSCCRP